MKKLLLSLLTAAVLLPASTSHAQDAAEGDSAMHAIGAMSAQALFSTFVAIAELGDLYAGKQYDKTKVLEMAGSLQGIAKNAKGSLSDLVASGSLGEEDETFVNAAIVTNDHLQSMAEALIAVAQEPTAASKGEFEKSRQRAWKSLSKLLGLES